MEKEILSDEEKGLIIKALKEKIDNLKRERYFQPKEGMEYYGFYISKYSKLISRLEDLPEIRLK